MILLEIHHQKMALKIEEHLLHVLYDYWTKTKNDLQTNMRQRYVAQTKVLSWMHKKKKKYYIANRNGENKNSGN